MQLERRHEQMKKNLEAQYKELEEKKHQFEQDKSHWEAHQRVLEQQKLDASKWDSRCSFISIPQCLTFS